MKYSCIEMNIRSVKGKLFAVTLHISTNKGKKKFLFRIWTFLIQNFLVSLLYLLALRVTLCLFKPALRGYSVTSLPWASRSHSRSLWSLGLCASHSHSQLLRSLGLCASHSHSQSLRSLVNVKIFDKKCVSINSKCYETHKKLSYPFDMIHGKLQPYLPHVTPRVPISVHADWSKTVGARGIHTHTQSFYQID